jgi:hypothetical protein
MKSSLLAAAAAMAAACAAAPGYAHDYQPNGFIGFDYAYDHLDSGSGANDVNSYGASGATNVRLAGPLNLELDADYARVDFPGGAAAIDNWGGDGHLFVRNDYGALGVVGGARKVGSSITSYDVGLEGAKFFDRWTLKGTARTEWNDVSGADFNALSVTPAAAYYVNDNFRLDGSAGYDRLQLLGKSWDGWNIHAGGEYQFARVPVSLYVAATYGEVSSVSIKDTAVHAGVRWNFGGGSLKQRERSGATFAPTGGDDFLRVANYLF